MDTRPLFLVAALCIATIGSAQAKVHNDNGALAAAGLLGGALGFLGGNYASQPSYGQSYGRQSYYPQPQPYFERPAYYAPPPVYYAAPGYVLVPPPGYYGPRYYAT